MAAGIPRVVWTLWLQGWDAAPPLVQACLRSWELRNPAWTIRPLTAETIGDYVDLAETYPGVNTAELPPAARSDMIRVALLCEHGGVWVDSTVFCVRPLDEWLDEVSRTGFFAFARPGPDRMLSSWFLAAQAQQPVMLELRDRVRDYWRDRTAPDHYFWFHRLFGEAYRSSSTVRDIWKATPTIRSDGAHYFVPYNRRLARPLTRRARARVSATADPVYKLAHRVRPRHEDGRSAYDFFCQWADDPAGGTADADGRAPRLLLAADRTTERIRWTCRHVLRGLRATAGATLRRTGVRRPPGGPVVREQPARLSPGD
jgi:hypothetical protein